MPFHLTTDDTAKRVIAVGEGEFLTEELLELLTRLRDSGAWSYGMVLDLRRMTGGTTVRDLTLIKQIADPADRSSDRRGPLAIVVASEALYVMARAYAALSRSSRVGVFRDLPEAEQWLAFRKR